MVQITELSEHQQFHFKNMHDNTGKPTFLKNISSHDLQQSLSKWDLSKQSSFVQLEFSPEYDDYHEKDFLVQLFNSQELANALHVANKKGEMSPLSTRLAQPLTADKFKSVQRLNSDILNLHFFDRLYEEGLVHQETDRLQKCFDVYLDHNLTVADEVRKLFVCPDRSDHYGLFDENDMNEFLYQIMKLVLTGGGLNQYEDELKPYLDAVKLIYKDLVTVRRETHSSTLNITSKVYMIDEYSGFDGLFPLNGVPGNVCFVIIDENKVTVWYHAFVDIW